MPWFDGKLTYQERRHLESLQNRASSHIYRLKHNDGRRFRFETETLSTDRWKRGT